MTPESVQPPPTVALFSTTVSSINNAEPRLCKLERESRMWRRIAVGLAIGLTVLLIASLFTAAVVLHSGLTLDSLRTRRLHILNEQGDMVAVFVGYGDGAMLILGNMGDSGSGIKLTAGNGQAASLRTRTFEIVNSEGRPVVQIGTSCGTNGGGIVNILNSSAQRVLTIQANKRNEGVLYIEDGDSNKKTTLSAGIFSISDSDKSTVLFADILSIQDNDQYMSLPADSSVPKCSTEYPGFAPHPPTKIRWAATQLQATYGDKCLHDDGIQIHLVASDHETVTIYIHYLGNQVDRETLNGRVEGIREVIESFKDSTKWDWIRIKEQFKRLWPLES